MMITKESEFECGLRMEGLKLRMEVLKLASCITRERNSSPAASEVVADAEVLWKFFEPTEPKASNDQAP